MPREATPEVNPNTVRNLCAHLVTVLANNAALSEDQVFSALGKLKAGTLLAMFCVIRFWALDTFARLSGIGSVSDWDKKFEELNLHLPKVSQSDLLDLASRTQDGTSLSLLTIAFDALRMMAIMIERKLDPLPIGKDYVRFRDTGSQENLENILRTISPSPGYHRIKGEQPEDRRSDIQVGFFNFIDKLQKKPVGDWRAFPHTALADHRPAPHPEWDQKAREFLSREIEDALKSDLPILSGRLENASLQMRTVVRDKYLKWCPQITFRATGEVVTAKNLDLEKITDEKMQELGDQFNPEIQLGDKEERENLERKLWTIVKSDPPLYWALMKSEGNKSKAAEILEISRTALYERLEKRLEKLKT